MKKTTKTTKKRIILVLTAALILSLCTPVSAASKDVTKKYKKKVSSMLKDFDNYLGSASSGIFKYDVYTRTSMLLRNSSVPISSGKKLSTTKSKLKSYMKLYFGSTSVNVRKYSSSVYNAGYNAANLFLVQNGKVRYMGGDWGTEYPVGTVKKIVQTSSKKFQVTYLIRLYNEEDKTYSKWGTFRFYLKKASNKYGFVITNFKRTASYVPS